MKFARIVLAAIGVISVFTLPPYVPSVLIFLLTLRWRAVEVLAIGALTDLVWLSSAFLSGFPIATVLSVLLLWTLEPFRTELLVERSLL